MAHLKEPQSFWERLSNPSKCPPHPYQSASFLSTLQRGAKRDWWFFGGYGVILAAYMFFDAKIPQKGTFLMFLYVHHPFDASIKLEEP